MILKIQKPISSTIENPPWLAYNQTRSYELSFYPSPKTTKLFKAGEDKIYIDAKPIDGGRGFETIKRVQDQEW